MSHQSVRFLLRDVSNSLADNIEFRGGRESEFNNLLAKGLINKMNYRWLLPMAAQPSNLAQNQTRMTTWTIGLLFMKKDTFDASAEQTNTLHDEVYVDVEKYFHRLDDWSQTNQDTVGDIVINNIRHTPFFKEQAGVYSGWRSDFQIVTPDDFIYCTPDNIEIYAGTYRNS